MKKAMLFILICAFVLSSCRFSPKEETPAASSAQDTEEASKRTTEQLTETSSETATEAETEAPTPPQIDVPAYFEENAIEGLEFWILQDMKGVDLSEYTRDFAVLGTAGGAWFGKDYDITPTMEMDYQDPYVEYTLNPWPDYADPGLYITHITITDPKVKVFGLTLQNTDEEWQNVLKERGFSIQKRLKNDSDQRLRADSPDGLYTIVVDLETGRINIFTEISNREGIVID